MNCEVLVPVKHCALKWLGHVRRMNEIDFAKRLYDMIEGEVVRGRPHSNESIEWTSIRKLAGRGSSMLRGSAETGKV